MPLVVVKPVGGVCYGGEGGSVRTSNSEARRPVDLRKCIATEYYTNKCFGSTRLQMLQHGVVAALAHLTPA